jgi:signal transduction histidine kinase
MQRISRLSQTVLDVPRARDAADARRRRLLNIFVFGIILITLLTLVATIVADVVGTESQAGQLYFGIAIALPVFLIIYGINRRVSGVMASSIFLLLLVWAFTLDQPVEVVRGRSLFLFALPILMASFLIRPAASFVLALLIGLVTLIIAGLADIGPNYVGVLAFQTFAFVSWLGGRTLEDALAKLEAINRELDQRVEQRTQELNEALARETVEARRLSAILGSTVDGVVVFDKQGTVILSNPAAAVLLETPELPGKDMTRLTRTLPADIRSALTQFNSQRRIPWGNNVLSVTFAPVATAEGNIIGQVGVFRDVTQEAKVEHMRDNFIAVASHELRTPLNAILGYSEMILSKLQELGDTTLLNHASRLIAVTNSFASLANNLLDKAQIDAGQLVLRYEKIQPAAVVETILQDMQPSRSGSKSQITLESDLSTAPAEVMADHQRITQVVRNLIQNAIKFTGNGTITVRAFSIAPNHWGVSVIDNGKGISAEAQKYIFDPYRQGDSTIAREHRGVGLGLSIVQQIIAAMGGQISVESKENHGSTFTVTLPVAEPAEKRLPGQSSSWQQSELDRTGSLKRYSTGLSEIRPKLTY